MERRQFFGAAAGAVALPWALDRPFVDPLCYAVPLSDIKVGDWVRVTNTSDGHSITIGDKKHDFIKVLPNEEFTGRFNMDGSQVYVRGSGVARFEYTTNPFVNFNKGN